MRVRVAEALALSEPNTKTLSSKKSKTQHSSGISVFVWAQLRDGTDAQRDALPIIRPCLLKADPRHCLGSSVFAPAQLRDGSDVQRERLPIISMTKIDACHSDLVAPPWYHIQHLASKRGQARPRGL